MEKEKTISEKDYGRKNDMRIHHAEVVCSKGDITTCDYDCIVNAANNSLLGGGGVDGAIHFAAGRGLLEECRSLGGCKTGEAKITSGYNLKAKYIIHTVGPIYESQIISGPLLRDCYRNTLNLAKGNDIHSIAFPAISTGVYGYPKEAAANIAVSEVEQWIKDNESYEIYIDFVCFDSETFEIYNKKLN